MTVASEVVDLLKTNASLVALLTGGIYSAEDLGKLGVTRTTLGQTAWDANSKLKPLCYVTVRPVVATPHEITDEEHKYLSVRQAVEVRVYQDESYDIIFQAKQKIFSTLHATQNLNRRYLFESERDERQSEELAGASETVLDYQAIYILKGDT
jgi:hypothetical protein